VKFDNGTVINFGDFPESRNISISIKPYPSFITFDSVEIARGEGTLIPANISVGEAKRIHEALGLAIASVEEGITK